MWLEFDTLLRRRRCCCCFSIFRFFDSELFFCDLHMPTVGLCVRERALNITKRESIYFVSTFDRMAGHRLTQFGLNAADIAFIIDHKFILNLIL